MSDWGVADQIETVEHFQIVAVPSCVGIQAFDLASFPALYS